MSVLNISMQFPKFSWPKFKMPQFFPTQTGPFPPKEWRAHVALIASIFGAVAFTIFSMGLVWIMWKGGWPVDTSPQRIEILGKSLMLALGGSLVVLISLGFAINRRSVKITTEGLEASGGEGDSDDPNTKDGDDSDGQHGRKDKDC